MSIKLEEIVKDIRMIVFDFDGVFTDNRVLVMQDGSEGVYCNRSDGIGLETVRNLDVHLMVISKEKNPVVGKRCEKLKLPCIQGCDNKSDVLRLKAEKMGISLQHIAFLGNDINDLGCLEIVGLPACVADSFPEVIKISRFVTKKKGGEGAVREFCDFVADVKRKG